jgi:chemotaxis protein histidine kinase CheA
MNQSREDRAAAAKARLHELATKFLDRSDGDLLTMRASLAGLMAGNAESLDEIRQLAHRMAGTGATLGFEGIAEHASRIEDLTDACAAGATPDGNTCARLGVLLEALAAELRRQRGT